MKICVCLKQVPSKEAPIHIDDDMCWVSEHDSRFETNEADQFALEEALSIKESTGAEVVVLSLGPDRVIKTLKEALAKGADRAVHLVADEDFRLDPLQLGCIIAAKIADEKFDLILSGLQSDDQGFGQTGAVIAERLGLPQASLVIEIQLKESGVRVRRELEAGWYQWFELPLPCALSIQSGINKPRYANMKGILAAKKKTIDKQEVGELLPDNLVASQINNKIYFPEKEKQTIMLEGNSEKIAAELFAKIGIL